jgi:hypothetical protein
MSAPEAKNRQKDAWPDLLYRVQKGGDFIEMHCAGREREGGGLNSSCDLGYYFSQSTKLVSIGGPPPFNSYEYICAQPEKMQKTALEERSV